VDREILLANARANGIKLGVLENAMGPLERVSDDVLQLMAETQTDKGFATILQYPRTVEGEAELVLG
jgi:hypothetical protein